MNGYILLGVAIASEVAATTALKASHGFTRLLPSLFVIAGYGLSFFLLSHVLKTVPIGVAYAIWSGIGIVGATLVALWLYGQKPDLPMICGIALIVAGVIVMQLFSKTASH